MRTLLTVVVFVLAPFIDVTAGDWPNWRGPNGNGVAEGTGYPVEWSEADVKWKFALNGVGASTPAVHGDKIFVTTTEGGINRVLCVGMDGSMQW